jgi:hypothetical protein
MPITMHMWPMKPPPPPGPPPASGPAGMWRGMPPLRPGTWTNPPTQRQPPVVTGDPSPTSRSHAQLIISVNPVEKTPPQPKKGSVLSTLFGQRSQKETIPKPDSRATGPVNLSWKLPKHQRSSSSSSEKDEDDDSSSDLSTRKRARSHSRVLSHSSKISSESESGDSQLSSKSESSSSSSESFSDEDASDVGLRQARKRVLRKGLVVVCRTKSLTDPPLSLLRRQTVLGDGTAASNPLPIQISSAQIYRQELVTYGTAPLELVRRARSSRASLEHTQTQHYMTWL